VRSFVWKFVACPRAKLLMPVMLDAFLTGDYCGGPSPSKRLSAIGGISAQAIIPPVQALGKEML
jgi:hypothetical protein